MADLKTNYVDDVLDTTKNQLRKYQQIQNDDGTVSFVDVTEYTQVGTSFGAKDINDTNAAINYVNGKLNNIKSEWIYLYGNDSSECYLKYKIEGTTCYVDAFIPITITTTSGWSLSSLLSAPLPKSKRTNAMAANFPAQCYYPNICVFGRMTTGGAIAVFANNSAFSLQTYNFAFNFTYEIYTSTAPIADVNL